MNEVNDRGYQLIKQELFKYLNADSNAYKDSYLLRRIRARMRKLGINDFMEYYRIIKKNKQELDDLLLTVAINVTEFFRDPIVWKTIERKVLPELIEYKRKHYDTTIRIWSAACSTGQEPYSIAMLFSEFLGDDLKRYRLKILATDIDREALNTAIRGVYPKEIVEKSVPKSLIQKYFLPMGDHYRISPQIRRYVEFRRFNLLSDRYPRGFDMIFIRNVLIYMTKEAQESVFRKLYDSLEDHGYLVLGKTETILGSAARLFKLYDLVARIYVKRKNVEVK
ncbi:CheR family methyltransferase [Thermococcus peptonophilus]|uniref:protein-glutamate O-methyltransferase n=1 Tax=Thermococcus peptonophilus TaxID=53952 RepID=A0A142CSQ2_9EURY|nr:protein-glutamate O-methyltransferase CheR [Thermococcus peptonophilus]AMQ17804.1 chemotaxis protein [Thermococcus peptonophilus]